MPDLAQFKAFLNPKSLRMIFKPKIPIMVNDFATGFDINLILDIDWLRQEIDNFMAAKMEELTPEIVKKLLDHVIRKHLHWLIIWGNIFGGFIGIVSLASG